MWWQVVPHHRPSGTNGALDLSKFRTEDFIDCLWLDVGGRNRRPHSIRLGPRLFGFPSAVFLMFPLTEEQVVRALTANGSNIFFFLLEPFTPQCTAQWKRLHCAPGTKNKIIKKLFWGIIRATGRWPGSSSLLLMHHMSGCSVTVIRLECVLCSAFWWQMRCGRIDWTKPRRCCTSFPTTVQSASSAYCFRHQSIVNTQAQARPQATKKTTNQFTWTTHFPLPATAEFSTQRSVRSLDNRIINLNRKS